MYLALCLAPSKLSAAGPGGDNSSSRLGSKSNYVGLVILGISI